MMRDFLKRKKIARLLTEGFAKTEIFSKEKFDIGEVGYEIYDEFQRMMIDIESDDIKDKIEFVLIKYMIWRLSRPLHPLRREQLLRRYGADLSHNRYYRVFYMIDVIAHEIIHEVLHEGSVEYFEKQNVRGASRDVEIELFYDFLEIVAEMFNKKFYWENGDEYLSDFFENRFRTFFMEWLIKNMFFTREDFSSEYMRFMNAFIKLQANSMANPIFFRFHMEYVRNYIHPLIRNYKFMDKIENMLKQIDAEYSYAKREIWVLEKTVYKFICDEFFKNFKEAYKKKNLIHVKTLLKVKEVIDELHGLNSQKTRIIEIIKKRILERENL